MTQALKHQENALPIRHLILAWGFVTLFAGLIGNAVIAKEQRPESGSVGQARSHAESVLVTEFGVVGDGRADDTRNFQRALNACSIKNIECTIPENKKVRITKPIYIWGNSSLYGERGAEILPDMQDLTDRYVVNLGISGKHAPEKPFLGYIGNITFRPISGPSDKWLKDKTPIAGRVIQIWRAENAGITNNTFHLGAFHYGATASHNNRFWLKGRPIKKQLTISGNTINATSGSHGMEGIGISNAEMITISNNHIKGVGDDVIGVHFCNNVKIVENQAEGVDGRIFLSNSRNILVKDNVISRGPSPLDGQYKKGVALIYVGFEFPARVREPKPMNTQIINNTLIYPDNAIDGGATINIRGAENTLISGNTIINNSPMVKAHGIWVAPWEDPKIRSIVVNQTTYPIIGARIVNNKLIGKYPLKIVQTGRCIGYVGQVQITGNLAKIGRLSCPKVVKR